MNTIKKFDDNIPTSTMRRSIFDEFYNQNFWPFMVGTKDRHTPAMNIREDNNNVYLDLQIPGMNKDDIRLEYEDGYLTICGERSNEKNNENFDNTQENNENGEKYIRKEFSYMSFYRTLEVPAEKYRINEAEACYNDGILSITLPKSEHYVQENKKIQIK